MHYDTDAAQPSSEDVEVAPHKPFEYPHPYHLERARCTIFRKEFRNQRHAYNLQGVRCQRLGDRYHTGVI